MFTKTCRECGVEFQAKKPEAKFCCQKCRLDFNNRRRDRGAMLYDVLMICRFDRERAAKVFGTNNVQTILSELATGFRIEDQILKRGKTWQSAPAAKEAMGTLRSITRA